MSLIFLSNILTEITKNDIIFLQLNYRSIGVIESRSVFGQRIRCRKEIKNGI